MARPFKPTALKVVTGNPGKRSINKNEPDPEYLIDLTAPIYLSKSASAVWDEIVPSLRNAKLLTKIDVPMLAMGCNAVAQYRSASHHAGDNLVKSKSSIDDDGKAVETGEHVNPWLIVQSMSFKQAMAVFQQFGMSPAARSRVAVNPQEDLFGQNGKTSTNYFT